MNLVADGNPAPGFGRQYGASPDDNHLRIMIKMQAKSFSEENQRHAAGHTKALYGM